MAIGVVYLFLLLASPLIAQPFYCEVYNFHNPTARNRAVADRVGMIQLYCRGGVAGTPRDFDITVSMNLPLGNRNPSGSYSDALLFLGNPPPYSQVANQNVFLGEFLPPGVGSKVPHSVRFHVHTTEPGPNEWQKMNIANIRVNSSGASSNASTSVSTVLFSVFATIDSSPRIDGLPATILVTNRTPYSLWSTTFFSEVPGYRMQVAIQEMVPDELRPQTLSTLQQGPSDIQNNSESGYFTPIFEYLGVYPIGIADSGTRIILKFSNVPPGQQVFVSVRQLSTRNPSFDLRLTIPGDVGGVSPFSDLYPTSSLPAPGIAPVTITNGEGRAVFEVKAADPYQIDAATIGIVLQGGLGSPTVTTSCGPLTDSQRPWIPLFDPPRPDPVIKPAAVFRDSLNRIRLLEYDNPLLYNAGGVFAGKPGAAQDDIGNTWIVARDTYNALYITRFDAATKSFDDWIFLGGQVNSDPSVSIESGIIYYTIRDRWNSCWLGIFRPGIGNSWRRLGGIFASDPQLTAIRGQVWIAGKDAWAGLWTATIPASHNVNTVIPWIFRGGILKGEVSLTRYSWAPLLAGRDNSNALWFNAFERDGVAQPWVPAQGIISRDPQAAGPYAVVAVNDSIHVRGIEVTSQNAYVPLDWVLTGGVLSSESPAWVNNELYIAGTDASNSIWWYRLSTNRWTPVGLQGLAASAITAVPR